MKIAAVVILYHPGEETLANINSYYNHVDKIYVFDNTEYGSDLKERLLIKPKIYYYYDCENEGIAKRLNNAAQISIFEGFDWLLMMDQDSSFSDEMIINYFKCCRQYQHNDEVAMFGVEFEQRIQPASISCKPVFSSELITSGTLLNLLLFRKIGQFDENLFIDGVDHEYTIRTLLAGYKIVQFPNIQLTHQIGILVNRASIKTLYLIKKQKKLHSPLRCYYVYRNNLYLQQKYKNTTVVSMQKMDRMATSIINTTLYYGRNSFQLMQYIYRAKSDFKRNKMGKLRK
jgi:rhamnosyltransferase